MGKDGLKAVLQAGAEGRTAYPGASFPNGRRRTRPTSPCVSRAFLDFIDERGMIPAGVKDLDQAQELLAGYGVFTFGYALRPLPGSSLHHELADRPATGSSRRRCAARCRTGASRGGAGHDGCRRGRRRSGDDRSKLSDFSFDGTELQKLLRRCETATGTLGELADGPVRRSTPPVSWPRPATRSRPAAIRWR